MDDHWKEIGYANKGKATEAIKRSLEENVDYSYDNFSSPGREEPFSPEGEKPQNHILPATSSNTGGRPKTKIYLTVNAFKNLCMLAGTPEGKEIRKYFVAVEVVTHKYFQRQLELKDNQLLLLSNSWIPSQDEINEHARILGLKGDKSNVFYQGKCQVSGDPRVYVKPGSVRSIRKLLDRVKEHERDFSKFLLFQAIECTDAEYVETEFKKLQIIKDHNKCLKGKKINNTETLLLDETLTTSLLLSAPFSAGKEYILDTPPAYSQIVMNTTTDLEVEKEREITKQKQIDLDLKKLEFEIEKWRSDIKRDQLPPEERQIQALREETNEVVEQWCKENIGFRVGGVLELTELNKRRFGVEYDNKQVKGKFRKDVEKYLQHSGESVEGFKHRVQDTGGSKKWKGISLI
jgi:hypothetical protein